MGEGEARAVEHARAEAVHRALSVAARYEAADAASFVDFAFIERSRVSESGGLMGAHHPCGYMHFAAHANLSTLGEPPKPTEPPHWAQQIEPLSEIGQLPSAQIWLRPQPLVVASLERAAVANAERTLSHNEAVRANLEMLQGE